MPPPPSPTTDAAPSFVLPPPNHLSFLGFLGFSAISCGLSASPSRICCWKGTPHPPPPLTLHKQLLLEKRQGERQGKREREGKKNKYERWKNALIQSEAGIEECRNLTVSSFFFGVFKSSAHCCLHLCLPPCEGQSPPAALIGMAASIHAATSG